MVNINETPAWEETIKLIERLERVAGGRDGGVNIQARQLANRTLFLYRELMSLQLVAYDAAAVFADTAAGLLSTSPGEYFKTPGDGQSLLIWQNNNGQALKVAELAGPESIKAIQASVARIARLTHRLSTNCRAFPGWGWTPPVRSFSSNWMTGPASFRR